MVWSTKGSSGPPLSILHVLFRQRVSVALQRAETTFILKHTIVVGEGFFAFFKFPILFSFRYVYCDWWGIWNMIVLMLVCDAFWVLFFWLGLGGPFSFFLFSPVPFCHTLWVSFFWLRRESFLFVLFFRPLHAECFV